MSIDLSGTFPSALVRTSDSIPVEQSFIVNNHEIKIVTFSRHATTCAGVVTKGGIQAGYFQRQGYVGNSLLGTVINPIIPIIEGEDYILTLDSVTCSFTFHIGKWRLS